MSQFGKFRPSDPVVSQDNLLNLHLKVSSVEELGHYPNNTIAVFTADDGEFKTGDIVVNRGDGKGWVTLKSSFATLGPVTDLRGYRMNKRVYLKWKDPSDEFNVEGKVKCRWHHDIVIRKYGSAPKNELDGTVVRTVYEKNLYGSSGSRYLIDYVPDSDRDAEWYYRVFSVADNGTIDYKRTAPAINLIDMKWSEIINLVKSGKASKMFLVGDSWRLDDGNELTIADIATSAPYKITFILRYSRYDIPFDTATKFIESNGSYYYPTKDDRITSGKVYYTRKPDGTFEAGSYYGGVIAHTTALDGKLYERVQPGTGRDAGGINRWMTSDIRMWMNLTDADLGVEVYPIRPGVWEYIKDITDNKSVGSIDTYRTNLLKSGKSIDDSMPIPPYFYLKKYLPEILDVLIPTQCATKMPKCDGLNMDQSNDYFFIPSLTETTGKTNGGYAEGKQFAVFKQGLIDPATLQNLTFDQYGEPHFAAVDMFTRSAWLLSNTLGCHLNPIDTTKNRLTASEAHGVIVAFNIG